MPLQCSYVIKIFVLCEQINVFISSVLVNLDSLSYRSNTILIYLVIYLFFLLNYLIKKIVYFYKHNDVQIVQVRFINV